MANFARWSMIFPILVMFHCLPAAAEEHKAPAPASAHSSPAKGEPQRSELQKAEPPPFAKTSAGTAKAEPASAIAERPTARRPAPVVEAPRPRPVVVAAPQRVAAAAPAPRNLETLKIAEPPATEPAHGAAPHARHWSYEGETGPHAWAKLAPEYAKCGNGQRQSPIDIRDGMRLDLDPVAFEYRPSGFRVVDNGHTIQANVNGWNSIRVTGRRYRLEQFHFHRPSEEMINGKQFEMVVHLVHKDGEGRLAVVAVLVEVGARQPVIQAVLNNLPLERGDEITAASQLDLAQLLPGDRRYFTYMGSLTTPPCTEDVLWIVMKQPVQATAEQLDLFSRMYPMNARPIQTSAGRMIKESN